MRSNTQTCLKNVSKIHWVRLAFTWESKRIDKSRKIKKKKTLTVLLSFLNCCKIELATSLYYLFRLIDNVVILHSVSTTIWSTIRPIFMNKSAWHQLWPSSQFKKAQLKGWPYGNIEIEENYVTALNVLLGTHLTIASSTKNWMWCEVEAILTWCYWNWAKTTSPANLFQNGTRVENWFKSISTPVGDAKGDALLYACLQEQEKRLVVLQFYDYGILGHKRGECEIGNNNQNGEKIVV